MMKRKQTSLCHLATAGAFAYCSFAAGCATTPKPAGAPPIELPQQWTSPIATDGSPQAWLDEFGSPTLIDLVDEALLGNANLERVAGAFRQSTADSTIAGADQLPGATLGFNGARQSINTFGPNATGGTIFNNFDLSLNLSWEVDLWGRVRNLSSAALASAEASQADLAAARQSLAAQVAKAWFNLIEAKTQVTEAEQTAETYQRNLATLESRFENGLAQGLELRQIRTLASNTQADVSARKRARDRAARNLETLLGRYPEAALSGSNVNLPELSGAVPSGLPADLLHRRPDLIAAERRLAAAELDVSAKHKDRLPKISLTASGGTSSPELEDLTDGDFSVWALAGNLTQPVFQNGKIKANIARSEAIRDQARAGYRDIALRAFLEVESTLSAEAYLRSEYDAARVAADEANAAESLAWERYRSGTVDFLNVLEIQRAAANGRARLISTQNALLQNRIDLYLALGGPFQETL